MEIKRVIYVGELLRTPFAPDHKGILQGLQSLKDTFVIEDFCIVDPILNNREEIIHQVNQFHPDLVVHGNTDSLSMDLIPHLEGKNWFFMGDCRIDGDYPWDEWVRNSKGLSGIFISNYDQIPLWQEKFGVPTHFWSHGCFVPEKLEYDPDEDHGLVFIGTMHDTYPFNKRVLLLKEIERYSPIPIKYINGSGVEGRNDIWKRMPTIYHSTKIILDVSHFWDLRGYASGRYWYSAGLGACTVTKRFPGCEEFYKDKVHKAYFDTPQEAGKLIEYYLLHPEERNAMKLSAYEHNKKEHNYRNRFLQLFELCTQTTASGLMN